eukprot:TRINITY_DN47467_c0_g1_i1.p1 TRINITY_DN47467_c0_g1~~TRINITY_DN47467_c0_g1_i1.p1  ORF type:complete len:260 (-),score=22.25 TRINITY_DN47467_c0_g1_i1:180-923(-)
MDWPSASVSGVFPSSGGDVSLPPQASTFSAATVEYPSTSGLSNMPAAPRFTFGCRSKGAGSVIQGPEDNPGPGSYYQASPYEQLARHSRSPKFSFPSATRQQKFRREAPGPGTYVPRSLLGRDAPSCSLTPRRPEVKPSGKPLPGPGAHNVQKPIGAHAPRISMGRARRSITAPGGERQKAPGPCDYEPVATKVLVEAVPSWGFGSARQRPRDPWDRDESTPGPGAYRHESTTPRGPKFSMRARTAR